MLLKLCDALNPGPNFPAPSPKGAVAGGVELPWRGAAAGLPCPGGSLRGSSDSSSCRHGLGPASPTQSQSSLRHRRGLQERSAPAGLAVRDAKCCWTLAHVSFMPSSALFFLSTAERSLRVMLSFYPVIFHPWISGLCKDWSPSPFEDGSDSYGHVESLWECLH